MINKSHAISSQFLSKDFNKTLGSGCEISLEMTRNMACTAAHPGDSSPNSIKIEGREIDIENLKPVLSH